MCMIATLLALGEGPTYVSKCVKDEDHTSFPFREICMDRVEVLNLIKPDIYYLACDGIKVFKTNLLRQILIFQKIETYGSLILLHIYSFEKGSQICNM